VRFEAMRRSSSQLGIVRSCLEIGAPSWGFRSQRVETTKAIARDREREFLSLASDDAAARVACDAPTSIAVDVVCGPVADARLSLGSHLLLR